MDENKGGDTWIKESRKENEALGLRALDSNHHLRLM